MYNIKTESALGMKTHLCASKFAGIKPLITARSDKEVVFFQFFLVHKACAEHKKMHIAHSDGSESEEYPRWWHPCLGATSQKNKEAGLYNSNK